MAISVSDLERVSCILLCSGTIFTQLTQSTYEFMTCNDFYPAAWNASTDY